MKSPALVHKFTFINLPFWRIRWNPEKLEKEAEGISENKIRVAKNDSVGERDRPYMTSTVGGLRG